MKTKAHVKKIGGRWQPLTTSGAILRGVTINEDGGGYSTREGAEEAWREVEGGASVERDTAPVTPAQFKALDDLSWFPEVWWHDLPASTAEVLRRRGWLREIRKCGVLYTRASASWLRHDHDQSHRGARS